MRPSSRAIQVLLAAACLWPVVADAALYELSVTRKAQNLYSIDGKRLLIQTRYCYVYAYSESAILKTTTDELVFLDSHDKCDIKAVYGTTSQKIGKYAVKVNREEDDWYEVWGQGLYIRTSGCIALAMMQDAILIMRGPTFGQLVFDDSNGSCMVEGVYSRARL